MKKIVLVTNSVWNAYNFRNELIIRLGEAGYQVYIIAPFDENVKYFQHKQNIYIEDIYLDTRGVNIFNDLKYILQLRKKFKKIQPHIVLNFVMKPLIYSSIIANMQKIPVINTQTGLGTAYLNGGLLSKISLFLYKIAYKNKSKKVLFHNKDDMNFFLQKEIVSKWQVDTVPGSGIDLDKFSVQSKSIHISNKKITFLFIARIIKDKGIGEFLDAIELFEKKLDVNFKIIGSFVEDNPVNIKLKERVLELDRKNMLSYDGYTTNIIEHILNADVIVMPSYREGTSRVLLEASALEKPIITTDVPGCNNIVIDYKTGLLCKSKNSIDLHQKIKIMTELESNQRKKMGREGRKYIKENFSVNIVVEQYMSIIRTILK